jgi:hypothetical protein
MGNTACWPSVIKKDNARRQQQDDLVARQQTLRNALNSMMSTSARSASEHLARAQVQRSLSSNPQSRRNAVAHMRLYKTEMTNHDTIMKQLATVDHTIRNLQKTEINHMIVTNAKAVSKFTSRFNADMGDVVTVMDDLAEGMAETRENEDALGQPIEDVALEMDDDQLMAELDNIKEENSDLVEHSEMTEVDLEMVDLTVPTQIKSDKTYHPLAGRGGSGYARIQDDAGEGHDKFHMQSRSSTVSASALAGTESFLMQM